VYVQGQGHTHYGPGTSMVQFTRPAFGMSGCGCGCGGKCGMGLFESGVDWTQWSAAEWSIVGLGAYVLFSTIFTTTRAARGIASIPSDLRKKKAARYRAKAKALMAKR
jgi:hypothetical protein